MEWHCSCAVFVRVAESASNVMSIPRSSVPRSHSALHMSPEPRRCVHCYFRSLSLSSCKCTATNLMLPIRCSLHGYAMQASATVCPPSRSAASATTSLHSHYPIGCCTVGCFTLQCCSHFYSTTTTFTILAQSYCNQLLLPCRLQPYQLLLFNAESAATSCNPHYPRAFLSHPLGRCQISCFAIRYCIHCYFMHP